VFGASRPNDLSPDLRRQIGGCEARQGALGGRMVERQRVDWDDYFMSIAAQVATRSTCDRKHVGAVIVREKMILATGYNGSLRGSEHCDDVGHLMQDGHCVRTVHAEANAIVQAARNGVRTESASIYVTASPCFACFKLIANAGIQRIVFGEFYRDERIFSFSERLGMLLTHLPGPAGAGPPPTPAAADERKSV
jgi:dCMP deaminase